MNDSKRITNFRLSPLWWPVLAVASPIAIPWLLIKNRSFQQNCVQAAETNQIRLSQATPLDIPELDFLELRVLVEWQAEEGFIACLTTLEPTWAPCSSMSVLVQLARLSLIMRPGWPLARTK